MNKKGLVPKLRFPEFRNALGWTKRSLADEGEIIRGLTYTSTQVKDTGLPVLRSSNIQRNRLLLDDDVVHVGVDCAPNMLLRADDLVVCMSNGSKPLVGKNAVYEPRDLRIRTIGAFCAIYRSTNAYARLLLSSPMYQTYVLDSMAGGNINNLTPNQLGSFVFPFPSDASEQRRIAECLESLNELLAAETDRLEALQQHTKGLLQQLFPAEDEAMPRLRLPKYTNAAKWKTKTLQAVATISSGTTPSRANTAFFQTGTIPWVKTMDLNNGEIHHTSEMVTQLSGVRVNPPGSVLVAMYGGFNQIGRTGMLTMAAATNQAIAVLIPDSAELSAMYLLVWLNANVELWKRVAASSRKDANITSNDVANFPISYPELDEQFAITSALEEIHSITGGVARKIMDLRNHKAALMQQLFPSLDEVEV